MIRSYSSTVKRCTDGDAKGSGIIVVVIVDRESLLMPGHAGSEYHINPARAIDTKRRSESTGREWKASRSFTPVFKGCSTNSGSPGYPPP